MPSNFVFLSLGSNQGDRAGYIQNAVRQLELFCTLGEISSFWKSKAWGNTDQEDFLNIIARVQTEQEPFEFLKKIQNIENVFGRIRTEKWGSRTIDIDIILWNQTIITQGTYPNASLQIPHIYAHQRAFVLAPLLEIFPEILFPNGVSAQHYWDKLSEKEKSSVQKCEGFSSPEGRFCAPFDDMTSFKYEFPLSG